MSFKTSFQWFADFNTSTTGMQIVQFSAGGEIVRKRLAPMFAHYRKYKLGAIHVKFVPAATLPVDPTGLSYEEGEQTVDPRDIFNPGLVRTTNGEDVYIPDEDFLNSESADSLYYSTMLDKRWKKFRLQKGIALRAFPKFWGVANVRQNMYPGYITNIPVSASASNPDYLSGITANIRVLATGSGNTQGNIVGRKFSFSDSMSLFQTGQKIPMGWMPTGASLKDEFGLLNGLESSTIVVKTVWDVTETLTSGEQTTPIVIATFDSEQHADLFIDYKEGVDGGNTYTYAKVSRDITEDAANLDAGATFAPVPEIPGLLTLCLPRSFKTQFYYRVYVKEDVYFADPVTSMNAIEVGDNEFMAPMDVFVRDRITPAGPAQAVNPTALVVPTAPDNSGGREL